MSHTPPSSTPARVPHREPGGRRWRGSQVSQSIWAVNQGFVTLQMRVSFNSELRATTLLIVQHF